MKILIVEPYFTGSHAAWTQGFQKRSRHNVKLLHLGGGYWKWRMHGGAVTLARRFLDRSLSPDVILASDMLDLTTFLSLTRAVSSRIPAALYFHENQLSYPWSPTDRDVAHQRDKHYGFINYASAMAADVVYFNSAYHCESFFEELDRLLRFFPDHNEIGSVDTLRGKSAVLPLGLDLKRFDAFRETWPTGRANGADDAPLVLWNHRWEYDKNPDEFFRALHLLADRGLDFRLAVLGENFSQVPEAFLEARRVLGDRIVQFGYVRDFESYARWLCRADVLPVTSRQDFFGASIAEAVYCGCRPLLPRRLAYPELIPEVYHQEVFYEDFDDLTARLGWMLGAGKQEPNRDLMGAMARFDWEPMAPQYDSALEALGRGNGDRAAESI